MQPIRSTAVSSFVSLTSLSLTVVALAACAGAPLAPSTSDTPVAPNTSIVPITSTVPLDRSDVRAANGTAAGAVFTLTNAATGNAVIAYHRAVDGALTRLGTFVTGGRGTGGTIDPLVSQYAVVVNADHDALFAVDAGSDQVSSFRINKRGVPTLAGTVASGGLRPVSLAVHEKLLYALNTGDNTLSGFRITAAARLVALPNAVRSLSPGASGAAAVHFTPDGRSLIVTERLSNRIEVFAVLANGSLGTPVATVANAGASFGFDVTRGNQPIVSETQGSLTSYTIRDDASVTPITASISTGGMAACWVTITTDGRFAYTTNAGSNFVAGFAIDDTGRLTPLTPGVPTGDVGAGATPIDIDHVGNRFLYTLEAGRGTIGTFVINRDGTLAARPDTPAGAPGSGLQGIAAF